MNIKKFGLRSSSIAIVCLVALIACMPRQSISAELQLAPSARCNVKVIGEIMVGDAERLSKLLDKEDVGYLCLNSDGGNYAEALKIIDVIFKRGGLVATIVERGDVCLSACAFVFLAGQKHLGDGVFVPFRFMSVGAKIGFHAPYITAEGSPNGEAARVYREGVRAIGRLLTLTAEDKQREEFFPRSLLAEALKVGPDDFFLMDKVDKLGRWSIRLFDHAKPERITNRMLATACGNADMWQLSGQSAEGYDYSVDYMGKPLPKEQRVDLVKRKYKTTLKGYGSEYQDVCNVMVYDHPKFGPFLALTFNDNRLEDPEFWMNAQGRQWQADDLELIGIGVPLYFMVPAGTSIMALKSK